MGQGNGHRRLSWSQVEEALVLAYSPSGIEGLSDHRSSPFPVIAQRYLTTINRKESTLRALTEIRHGDLLFSDILK